MANPLIYCFAERKKSYSRSIAAALAQGCGGEVVLDRQFRKGIPLIHGMADWQKALFRTYANWYEVDHAYFGRMKYHRVTHNGFWHSGIGKSDHTRLKQTGIRIEKKITGKSVLVVTQSDAFYQRWAGVTLGGYVRDVLRNVKKHSKRNVKVRYKPTSLSRGVPIEADLDNAGVVITHSSAVALEALCRGIPVIVTEPNHPAHRFSIDYSQIDAPPSVNMQAVTTMMAVLADNQWTLAEMKSGKCWKDLHGNG